MSEKKPRKWRTYRGNRENCPYPKLFRRIGLRPANTKFNKRAAAYARAAAMHMQQTMGDPPLRPVEGMKE